MATNETEFARKMKKFFANRAVIVTAVTLLVATGIIIAATVSANRAKKPIVDDNTPGTGIVTKAPDTQATPSIKDEARQKKSRSSCFTTISTYTAVTPISTSRWCRYR